MPDVDDYMIILVVLEEENMDQHILKKFHLGDVQFAIGIGYEVLKTGHDAV